MNKGKVQKFTYEELGSLSNDQITRLTLSGTGFVVITDNPTGARIVRFLQNEENFRSQAKSLRSRIGYPSKAWVGIFLIDFLHLWVSSVNAGYEVTVMKNSRTSFEFEFRN